MASHRLLLGDCLDVMGNISDGSIDMVLSDLPYGTTQNKWDSIIPLDRLWEHYWRICKGAVVLTAAQPFTSTLVTSNLIDYKYEWIWRKQQGTGFLNAKKQPLRNHEQIVVFYKKQPTYFPQMLDGKPYTCKSGKGSSNYNEQVSVITKNKGERYPLTVLDFKYDKNKVHPTQKPVALMEYMIKTYTNEGDTVLDNCMGSGTTGVACQRLNRNFIGIEKEKKYFDIATERIKKEKDGEVSTSGITTSIGPSSTDAGSTTSGGTSDDGGTLENTKGS